MRNTLLSLSLALICLIIAPQTQAANNYLTAKLKKSNIVSNASVNVKAYDRTNDYILNRVNVVSLVYDRGEQTDIIANGEWRYTVNFKIYDPSDPSAFHNSSVKVFFEADSAVYEDVKRFNIAFQHARLEVTSIQAFYKGPLDVSFSSVAYPETSNDIPNDIHLELRTVTNYRASFNSNLRPKLTFDASSFTAAWSYIEGAEDYDLEYVFIDAQDQHPTFSTDDAAFIYKTPVRIRKSGNFHTLKEIYPAGKLYFRVRANGRYGVYGEAVKNGKWCYNINGSSSGTAITHTITNAFETNKNWQITTTYAEEGKSKSVVSFFDGTSRSRQQQTNLSTENLTLVGETKYDSEGRGVVQLLPVPKESNDLDYEVLFNRDDNGNEFERSDFEEGPVSGLSDNYGAGKYYSANNPFNNNPFQDFTPEATDGYAFTQVEYISDNTGKVRRQSGLGGRFRLTSSIGEGRSTEYYYGTPTSTELHRLFGTNVGKASHYKKVLTVDANEQLSMTYQDQEGRTIATSLVGQGPKNLQKLPSNDTTLIRVSLNDNNVKDIGSGQIKSITKLMNVVPNTLHKFSYEFKGGIYYSQLFSSDYCVDCEYNLEITVRDPEGDSVIMNVTLPAASSVYRIKRSFGTAMTTGDCTNGTQYIPADNVIKFNSTFGKIGDYTVTKVLTLSEENIDAKIADALDDAGLGSSYLDNLIDEYQNDIYTIGCYSNCEDHCFIKTKNDHPSWNPSSQQFKDAVDSCINHCADVFLNDSVTGYFDTLAKKQCNAILYYIYGESDDANDYRNSPQTHPAYCHYWICDSMSASNAYDTRMSLISDWDDATKAPNIGYADPLNTPFQDPFYEMIGRWNSSLQTKFYDAITKYYEDPDNAGTFWTLSQYVDNTVNPDLYKAMSGGYNAKVRWQVFRGAYMQEKLKIIEDYKASINCDYGDIDILDPPVMSDDRAVLDQMVADYLTATADECSTICETNVEFWMDQLALKGCDSLSVSDQAWLRNHLSAYCLSSCGENNPLGLLVGDSLDSGNYPLLNSIDSMLTANGCSSDSIFQQQPYIWHCYYKLDSCMIHFIDFMNNVVFPDFIAKKSGAPASSLLGTYCDTWTVASTDPNDWDLVEIEIPLTHPLRSCIASGQTHITFNTGDCVWMGCGDLAANCSSFVEPPPCAKCTLYCATTPVSFFNMESFDETNGWNISQNIMGGNSVNFSIPGFVRNNENVLVSNTFSVNFNYDALFSPCNFGKKICKIIGVQDTIAVKDSIPCEQRLLEIAEWQARKEYEDTVNFFREKFLDEYRNKCFNNSSENFYADYVDNEYHYTLYYYDQASNLVQTVPPEGVNELDARGSAFTNGVYDGSTQPQHTYKTQYKYNGLNQVVWQETPDAGVTRFWYDDKSQLRFSQNSAQLTPSSPDTSKYSYTKYDGQGRIVEVGENQNNATCPDFTVEVNSLGFPGPDGWDITTTVYEDNVPAWINTNGQLPAAFSTIVEDNGAPYMIPMDRNTRGRVSNVFLSERKGVTPQCFYPLNFEYETATHYAYDAHGNVKRLIQEDHLMRGFEEANLWVVDYGYDLLSGNVNMVRYQPDKADEFMHRYYYNADERITSAYTSSKGYIWEKDATYFYYPHGPLARAEIGDDMVQGTDHAYTLQGWLKAVNSNTLNETRDMGQDGKTDVVNQHGLVARDVFGYSLDYYIGDYNDLGNRSAANHFIAQNTASTMADSNYQLYNGNVQNMVVAMTDLSEQKLDIYGYEHRYDQLNRIVARNTWKDAGLAASNNWSSAYNVTDHRVWNITYDANGNIQTLDRTGQGINIYMDDLSYTYGYNHPVTGKATNWLKRVNDTRPAGDYGTDIDGQSGNNYSYDNIGNLVSDTKEEIDEIVWNSYGKVKEIKRTNSSTRADLEFFYGPDGNRIAKVVKPKESNGDLKNQNHWIYYHYVRDAQGNVLSNYKHAFQSIGASKYASKIIQNEVPLYGSGRLGIRKKMTSISANVFKASMLSGEFAAFNGDVDWTVPVGYNGGIISVDTSLSVVNTTGTTTVRFWGPSDIEVWSDDGGEGITLDNGNAVMLASNHYRIPAGEDVTLSTISPSGLLLNSPGPISISPNSGSEVVCAQCEGSVIRLVSTVPPWANVKSFRREMGLKAYELTNHLGNVYETVTDRKIGIKDGNNDLDYYSADVVSYNDYYPFGSLEPGRNASSEDYRYGFNGKEYDQETQGQTGTVYDFSERLYDARLGKFYSRDPKEKNFAMWSPYLFAANSPIQFTDKDGEGPGYATLKGLAIVSRGTFAVATFASVYVGTVATASKGMAVDKDGNVAFFVGMSGLANQDAKGPSVVLGAGMVGGVRASFLPGVNKVTDLKGQGASFGVTVGPPFAAAGVSLESDAYDDISGFSISGVLGPNIGHVGLEVTKTNIVAMTANDYEIFDNIASNTWKKWHDFSRNINRQPGRDNIGIWEAGPSELIYEKVEGTENTYEAVITTTLMFKPMGTGGAEQTNMQMKDRTGILFSADKDGNLTSKSFDKKK